MAKTREERLAYHRAYYAANKDRMKAQNKEWKATHPARVKELRDRTKVDNAARTAAWRAANPERAAESVRAWVKANEDWVREYQQVYRGANKERRKVLEGRRRARIAKGDLTLEQWQAILVEFDHRCAYCQGQDALELEHMTPLSRGGLHTADNVVPACRDCNARKYNRTIFEFLALSA